MKLEVPIKVDIDDVTKLIHDLQCLQTYKLGANDTTVLVSLDAVVGVFADHIRAKRLGKDTNVPSKSALDHIHNVVAENEYKRGYEQGFKDVADTNVGKWIPVTPDTMPEENRVVVVCGEKGTWDYGTYRGHLSSINNWNWKKNTVKTVYWWMYKEDALCMPPKGE